MRWISVSKQLPKESENVLAVFVSGYDGKGYVAIGSRFYDDGWLWAQASSGGELASADTEIDDQYTVTHWMHIPKPPRVRK
jgi:hypothetical protein